MLEINQFNIRHGVYKDNATGESIVVRSIVTHDQLKELADPKVIYEPLKPQYQVIKEQTVMVQVGIEMSVKEFLSSITIGGKEQPRFTYQ
jgi:hypothetical protein